MSKEIENKYTEYLIKVMDLYVKSYGYEEIKLTPNKNSAKRFYSKDGAIKCLEEFEKYETTIIEFKSVTEVEEKEITIEDLKGE